MIINLDDLERDMCILCKTYSDYKNFCALLEGMSKSVTGITEAGFIKNTGIDINLDIFAHINTFIEGDYVIIPSNRLFKGGGKFEKSNNE